MKIKTLFAAILAAGLLFSGCRQDEDYVLPDLRVGTESLEFGQQSNEQTVDVTASREWLVRSKPDWVAIDPDHGPASSAPQRVTVTVLDNAGYDRSGDVVFSIGLSKAAVTVNQKGAKGAKSNGTGTLDDPYTVEGALAAVANLTWTSSTEYQATEVVYVKGIISRIAENGSFAQTGTFGNGNFYISDDGATGDKEFYCYRVLYLGNKKYTSGTDIKVGDEVVICGKLMNYRGNTPETVANEAYLYSLNGVTEGGGGGGGNTGTPKGTGTQADPYNAAAANAAVANLTWTSTSEYQTTDPVYVKGKISRIADKGTYTESGTYGNASFYISDDGATGGSEFYCFHVLYLGNQKYTSGTDIKVGDEVIVYGKLMNYRGNTPETANGAYLYSLNGTTQGGGGGGGNTGTPKGTGTQADPYNAAAANAAASTLTYTDKDNYQKSDNVYIKGKISRIAVDKNNVEQVFTAQFGNASFYISDDGSASNEFYVYRALFLGNAKWQEGNTQIKVGDEVIICGKLMNFNGKTPETVANESYIYSLNGTTQGGGGGGGQTQISYSKVSTITAGGKYILVGVKEGKYYAATPIASDKTYGRLNGKEITVSSDKITADLAANEFTITAVNGGYEIAMPDGRKLAVDTEHDGTFQIGDSFDHTFTAELSGDLFKISHKSTGKTIYHGGGTYTNFSCSTTVPADGTLLQLYLKDN